MANWCSNAVVFEGEPEAIEQIQQLFKAMAKKQEKEECGQLPDFVEDSNGGYFFNIYWNEGDTGIFQYETKWSPNTEVLQSIADLHELSFIQEYEEMGNLVYGRATYSEGMLNDVYLEEEDFDQYQFDEQTEHYHFEGETFESDYEIVETLLERKIAKNKI